MFSESDGKYLQAESLLLQHLVAVPVLVYQLVLYVLDLSRVLLLCLVRSLQSLLHQVSLLVLQLQVLLQGVCLPLGQVGPVTHALHLLLQLPHLELVVVF